MTGTIKVEVESALAERFRKKAMEVYGYRKGAVKKAMEDLIRKFTFSGAVDWGSLKGTLKVNLSSVELQHAAWVKAIDSNRHEHNP
jgi:hypothetical protein